ncbi:MAG: S41 family peptidase [Fibrobacterota bacterium]
MRIRFWIFLVCAATLLVCQSNPVYEGPVDIEEQLSVWQYLKTYSIYQDCVPSDPLDSGSAIALFRAVNDSPYTFYPDSVSYAVRVAELSGTADAGFSYVDAVPVTDSTVVVVIREFTQDAYSEFLDKLPILQNYPYIVFDLRGNGGGELFATDSVIECILPAGCGYIIERYREYDSGKRRGYTVGWDTIWTERPAHTAFEGKRFSVLMDRRTASASEIMAAALKDCASAYLVGDTSYGKGIGQVRIPRTGRAMLSITFMEIRGVSDRIGDYHKTGIRPDPVPSEMVIEGSGIRDSETRDLFYAVRFLEKSVHPLQIQTSFFNLRKTRSPEGLYIVSEPDPLGIPGE